MEPKRNTNTDSPSSRLSMKTSLPMMLKLKVTPRESTTSPTGPTTNGNQSKDTKPAKRPPKTSRFSQLKAMLPQSIGEAQVLSPQLRTKVHADHAGLSQPPVPSKVLTRLPRDHSSHSQNNNWLTAHPHTETPAVTEDGWTMPSTILKLTNSRLKATTVMPELEEPASTTLLKVSPMTDHTLMLPSTTKLNSKLPSTTDQSQLPLKLIKPSSNHTLVESSHQLLAEPHWITVSSLLDMELKDQPHIGLLRTLGDHLGENLDMSDSQETKHLDKVSAVSKKLLHTQPFEIPFESSQS